MKKIEEILITYPWLFGVIIFLGSFFGKRIHTTSLILGILMLILPYMIVKKVNVLPTLILTILLGFFSFFVFGYAISSILEEYFDAGLFRLYLPFPRSLINLIGGGLGLAFTVFQFIKPKEQKL
jgi:hypothetical protein